MKEIAVIIPVYKAHDTIKKTLCSIFMQKAVDFTCYMVVDGAETGSYDYLKDVFNEIDLVIYYMEKNAGPGVARQYGIDHSQEPYISFIDADDTYLSSLALYYQKEPLEDEKNILVSTNFLQENKDHTMKLRDRDMVWMHGKMYRRSFLDKYDIRFNETRANEDVGVNTQCQCIANENEQIFMSHNVTYMWQWRDNSTVRTDNNSYAFNESVEGYVINKIYAFETVLSKREIDDGIKYFILGAMLHLFKKYLAAMLRAPKQMKHIKKWAKKYYYKIYKLVDKEYIDKAERTVLISSLNPREEDIVHYHEEFNKWKDMLQGKKVKK